MGGEKDWIALRGTLDPQADMYCLISPEKFVPADHPLRAIKPFADQALRDLSPLFDEMYAQIGHPSIPPERLLKAKLRKPSTPSAARPCWSRGCTTTCSSAGSST